MVSSGSGQLPSSLSLCLVTVMSAAVRGGGGLHVVGHVVAEEQVLTDQRVVLIPLGLIDLRHEGQVLRGVFQVVDVDLHAGGEAADHLVFLDDLNGDQGLSAVQGQGQLGAVLRHAVLAVVDVADEVPQVLILGHVHGQLHHGGGVGLLVGLGRVIGELLHLRRPLAHRVGEPGDLQLGGTVADLAVGVVGPIRPLRLELPLIGAGDRIPGDRLQGQALIAVLRHGVEIGDVGGGHAGFQGGQLLLVDGDGVIGIQNHRVSKVHRDGDLLAGGEGPRRGGEDRGHLGGVLLDG